MVLADITTKDDLLELREVDEDEEQRSPHNGGCYICWTGNGFEDDGMVLDMDLDVFAHPDCLWRIGRETVWEYEVKGLKDE